MTLKHTYISVFLIALAIGCGSRQAPAEFPAGSAASPETPPGPVLTPVELASERSAPAAYQHPGHEPKASGHAGHNHPSPESKASGHSGHKHANQTDEHRGHDDGDATEVSAHAGHDHPNHDASRKKVPSSGLVYVCPMHPKVTSNEPGDCPKCGMTLEEQK